MEMNEELLGLIGDLMTQEEIANLDFGKLEILESEEEKWQKEREEKFTCSEFVRLMADEESKELSKGALSYVVEKVLQIVTEQPRKVLYLKQLEHGKEFEEEAVLEFQKKTGKVVKFFGKLQKFVRLSKRCGGTPDGLIGDDEGIETKCPDSKTHYEYLRFLTSENFKQMLPKYYWQIQGLMHVCNRKKWYFVSYDPRFKNIEKRLLIIEIKRNEGDITNLKRKIFLATKELEKQLSEF